MDGISKGLLVLCELRFKQTRSRRLPLDCGGKRQDDTAVWMGFGRTHHLRSVLKAHSEGCVALSLPAAVQGTFLAQRGYSFTETPVAQPGPRRQRWRSDRCPWARKRQNPDTPTLKNAAGPPLIVAGNATVTISISPSSAITVGVTALTVHEARLGANCTV